MLMMFVFLFGAAIGVFGISPLLGTLHTALLEKSSDEIHRAFSTTSDTPLVNPLLGCTDVSQSISDQALNNTKKLVQQFVTTEQTNGDITTAAIYFRDLNNGPWFGLNESQKFFPASLLKVPLAISFYSKADSDPTLLSRKITYTPNPSVTSQVQPYSTGKNIESGKSYTIKELIQFMLEESSNEAADVLSHVAGQGQIDSTYQDLGLESPTFGEDYRIDIHHYASFFRILYNATYLDPTQSQAVLSMLAKASFMDGLIAGVPSTVTVAHKFGSRQVDSLGVIVQLHDCGIIYVPGKPYQLCVMTQGNDFPTLAKVVQHISSLVYSSVTSPS